VIPLGGEEMQFFCIISPSAKWKELYLARDRSSCEIKGVIEKPSAN
jgi:hypothetical protein